MKDRTTARRALLFALPALVIYIAIVAAPLAQTILYSFVEWKGIGDMRFVGLANYRRMLTDSVMLIALRNVFVFMATGIFIMLPAAFLVAFSLTRVEVMNRAYSAVVYVPVVLSTVVIGIMWSSILNPDTGVFDPLVRSLGLRFLARPWLSMPETAIFPVVAINIWQWTGLHMIIYLTALESISPSLYESARIDGASQWHELRHISIPLTLTATRLNVSLVIIGSLKTFDLVFAVTGGGPINATEVLGTYMYRNTFRRFDFGYGGAIAVAIFVLSLTGVALQSYLVRRRGAR